MYGLSKTHKERTPLRPILSIIKSAQQNLAKEHSLLLGLVLDKFSCRVVSDLFSFVKELRERTIDTKNLIMCSFDMVSLFTNIPLDEIIIICVNTLYHTDITPTEISEDAFCELMLAATKVVGFSFGETMLKQIDGVPMGSLLSPALADIFVGYHESRLFQSISHELPE